MVTTLQVATTVCVLSPQNSLPQLSSADSLTGADLGEHSEDASASSVISVSLQLPLIGNPNVSWKQRFAGR